jgi:aspartyl-tRNA(Asn)/glutamyl-tRNA(Gln) amidotransferase subunit A
MRERAAFASEWDRFFQAHDLLLCPTMQVTALPLGVKSPREIDGQPVDPFYDDWCSFCLPANLTGQPSVSVACGQDREGLPIGLQVIGPRFREDLVLRVAAAWESIVIDQGATSTWR